MRVVFSGVIAAAVVAAVAVVVGAPAGSAASSYRYSAGLIQVKPDDYYSIEAYNPTGHDVKATLTFVDTDTVTGAPQPSPTITVPARKTALWQMSCANVGISTFFCGGVFSVKSSTNKLILSSAESGPNSGTALPQSVTRAGDWKIF